jgi:hypothetical protein
MFVISKTNRNLLSISSFVLVIGLFALSSSLSGQGNIELYNRYQKGSLQFENGKPVLKSQGNNSIWMIETIANSTDVRIKHVPTGGYLHAETDARFPAIGPIQPGWLSAMWNIEFTDEGYYRIKNKWRGTYLRNETGVVELGESQPGWWGGQWLYVSPGVANGRAVASRPTGRLKIRGVYIVPSDQTEKPRAKEAIAACLEIMRVHFFRQIGVTFEYEPEVAVIYSNHNTKATASMEIALELCKKTLGAEYESNKNIMFTVVEGCPGNAAFGTPGLTRIQQGFWGNVYNTFINNPQNLASTLPAWSHELGHAFGLQHTGESTKACMLKECQVDMGTLPSLLMQQSKAFATVYEYPFHKDEIKMLLDSTYCQKCLIDRGNRPAAVRYLRSTSLQANPPSLNPGAGLSALNNKWVRISNLWKPDQRLQIEAGPLTAAPIGDGALSAQWNLVPVPGTSFYWIKNRWKPDQRLHVETGQLVSAPIGDGAWSAHWELKLLSNGAYWIQNRWRTGQRIHIQNGKLEFSAIQDGANSAIWYLRPVQ